MKPASLTLIAMFFLSANVYASEEVSATTIVQDTCRVSPKHCALISSLKLADNGRLLWGHFPESKYSPDDGRYMIRASSPNGTNDLRVEIGYNKRTIFEITIE
jgi:hypothetical protein